MEPRTAHPELERLLTHQDWLRSLARKLVGDPQAAEDLVQETWMAAMKSPPDPARPARPWLAGVVRRLASMRARGEGRRARRQNAVAVSDELPSTADLVEEVDTQRRLVSEVLKLAEPYRTTVMLRYFNNLSSAEIARHQDVPAGTVRWRLKRGLDELRERLDDSFGSRENWCMALLPLAKLGAGGGTAATAGTGLASAGLTVGAMKWVAGILVLLGSVYVGSIVAERLRPLWAAERSASLVSIEPERERTPDTLPERVALASQNRDALAPAERQIRFLEPSRDPIAGMLVVLDDGSEQPPVGQTDEQGRVAFTTALRQGSLYVQRPNSLLQRVDVEFTAAGIDAFLPWQAELSGRVIAPQSDWVGGAETTSLAGLPLRIDSDVLWLGEANVPNAVLARFEQPGRVTVQTAQDGSFQVANLPADWSGKLWLPEQVVVQGADRREETGRYVYFAQPQRNATVLVDRLPMATGRILASDQSPAEQVLVQAWVDGASTPLETRTDAQGRFALQLDSAGRLGLHLEAVGSEGLEQLELELAGHEIPDDFVLGDLQLLTATRVAFLAQHGEDEPLAGVRGYDRKRELQGQVSDEEGLGEVILPAGTSEAWVAARGFQPVKIASQGTLDTYRVHLQPAAALRLHVLNFENLSLSDVELRVGCAEGLFAFGASSEPAPWEQPLELGRFLGMQTEPGGEQARFAADERGRVQLVGVRPGAPLYVEVVDGLGQRVHQQRIAALGEGEQREERLVVPQRLRELHAVLRDRSDNLLVGVQVELVDGEGQTVLAESNLEGLVSLRDLAGDEYEVRLQKRGFVSQSMPGFRLSGGVGASAERPLSWVLDRGHDVAVLVVDPEDRPVSGGVVSARRISDGAGYQAHPSGAADQTLQDLDQGAVEVTLRLGGQTYVENMQAPLARSVEFRVPAHASLEVQWTSPEGITNDEPLRLVAQAVDEAGQAVPDRAPVVQAIGARTDFRGLTVFPALLPGSYQITLQREVPRIPGDGGTTERVWQPIGLQQPVEVALGPVQRLVLAVR